MVNSIQTKAGFPFFTRIRRKTAINISSPSSRLEICINQPQGKNLENPPTTVIGRALIYFSKQGFITSKCKRYQLAGFRDHCCLFRPFAATILTSLKEVDFT